ncbi:DUF3017 domain-containing protein [Aestuariimicrobium kwangyangense]|uniref:DUF3017 domain-containing protein n=1 Tax=Aestuariimicrobium kwangyangense TaxID=396389 RepID=UPI0003B5F1CD|nr:DUF3017 domain-containing protein [Aestuariimicrobium kwangyangense]
MDDPQMDAPTGPGPGTPDPGPGESSTGQGASRGRRGREQGAEERRRFRLAAAASARGVNQWPLLAVLGCLAVAFGVVATGHWRKGAFAVGCAVLFAGFLRAVLPAKTVGLLAVRARWFDTLLLVLSGGAMLVLTMLVPPSPPR